MNSRDDKPVSTSRVGGGLTTSVRTVRTDFPYTALRWRCPITGSEINPLFPPTSNKLFQYTNLFGNRRRVFLMKIPSPIPTWFAHLSHLLADFAEVGFLHVVCVLSSRLLPAIHRHRHHRYYESVRLLVAKLFDQTFLKFVASFRLSHPGYTFLTSVEDDTIPPLVT